MSPNRSDRRLIVIMLALLAASVLWAMEDRAAVAARMAAVAS